MAEQESCGRSRTVASQDGKKIKMQRKSSLGDFSPGKSPGPGMTDEEAADEWTSLVQGKVVLVVNVACLCGFTGQYKQLQELQDKYQDQGFTVVGFPCNQFGKQEPWEQNEIEKFAEDKFKVTFPIYAKINVNGKESSPLYQFLKTHCKGIFGTESVKWNFTKFLCGRDGVPYKRYGSLTKPLSLTKDIEKLLAASTDTTTTTVASEDDFPDAEKHKVTVIRQAMI